MDEREYFAALPTEEAGKAVAQRIEHFYQQVDTLGYFDRVKKSHFAYYGSSDWKTSTGKLYHSNYIRREGERGQEYAFKVNTYRNLVQHLLVMTTAERLAFECQAGNTDAKSLAQSELGDSLLDYYMIEQRVERFLVNACEFGLVYAGGHIGVFWDTQKGKQYGRDDAGRVVFDGDLSFRVYTPLDVAMDIYRSSHDHLWKAARSWVNAFDLAATYPEQAENILSQSKKSHRMDRYSFAFQEGYAESDDIAVFDFYHDKTPSVPEGRHLSILEDGTVLFDGPLPYKKVPIYSLMPSRIADCPFGYTTAFDLLSIQEASDIIHSSILSNQATFGTQLIGLLKGSDIDLQVLGQGLAAIFVDPALGEAGFPRAINLTQTPAELFKYAEMLDMLAEKTSGLNSIVRGQPQGQLTGASGAAMALLAATAQQFNQGLQREYEMMGEDVATAVIQTLQLYATTPRVALIAGQAKRSRLKEFSATDIESLERVRIKRSSALSRTTSGKLEIAKDLLNAGMVENPAQYVEAIKTGTIEPMFESQMSRSLLIRRENEWLREGQLPPVLRTDNHQLHIQEHLNLLDDPEIRFNAQITQNVLTHIQEHESWMQPPAAPPPQPGAGLEGAPADMNQTQDQTMQGDLPAMPGMPNMPQGAPPEAQAAYEQMAGAEMAPPNLNP